MKDFQPNFKHFHSRTFLVFNMSLAIVSAWSTKFPNNLFRQSQYSCIAEREGFYKIYICRFLFWFSHVASVWHGLVKALTVSNSLNIQPPVTLTYVFQALLFPPDGPVSLLLWSCCLFHATVSQNLKCLWDHEVIGVSCVCKDGTRYSSLHIWDMHKSKICYLSVYNLWSNCCFRSLNRVMSHNIFSSVCTCSAAARPRQWRRYLWEVGFECQFCVCFLCLWLEWKQSVYVKLCKSMLLIKSMWIHFRSNKVFRLLLMFPCTIMVQILMMNKSSFLLFVCFAVFM